MVVGIYKQYESSRSETELGNQITTEIKGGYWLDALIVQLDYFDCNQQSGLNVEGHEKLQGNETMEHIIVNLIDSMGKSIS